MVRAGRDSPAWSRSLSLRTQGKNQLLVAATDLDVSLTAELKSHNASEGGLTVGAKKLIANAPPQDCVEPAQRSRLCAPPWPRSSATSSPVNEAGARIANAST